MLEVDVKVIIVSYRDGFRLASPGWRWVLIVQRTNWMLRHSVVATGRISLS